MCGVADPTYLAALGRAVFAFAALEATAIQACELIAPGAMAELEERTAGRVADQFVSLTLRLPQTPTQERAVAAARRFQALVRSRNNLLHAKPGLDHVGRGRLFRGGDPWSIGELENIAAQFDACAGEIALLIGTF